MHLEQICGHRAHSHKLPGLYILWWHNSCPKSRLFWLGFLSTSHTKPFVFWGSGRDKPRRHLTKWCKCTIVNNDTRHYTSVGLISVKYTSVALYFEKYTSVAFMLSLRAIWPSGTSVFSRAKCKCKWYKCRSVLFETQVSTMIQDTAPQPRTYLFFKKYQAKTTRKQSIQMSIFDVALHTPSSSCDTLTMTCLLCKIPNESW